MRLEIRQCRVDAVVAVFHPVAEAEALVWNGGLLALDKNDRRVEGRLQISLDTTQSGHVLGDFFETDEPGMRRVRVPPHVRTEAGYAGLLRFQDRRVRERR